MDEHTCLLVTRSCPYNKRPQIIGVWIPELTTRGTLVRRCVQRVDVDMWCLFFNNPRGVFDLGGTLHNLVTLANVR